MRAIILSERQIQVLEGAAAGMTSKETASDLRISLSAVKGHLSAARVKLGCQSTLQAVAIAVTSGLERVQRAAKAGWQRGGRELKIGDSSKRR